MRYPKTEHQQWRDELAGIRPKRSSWWLVGIGLGLLLAAWRVGLI